MTILKALLVYLVSIVVFAVGDVFLLPFALLYRIRIFRREPISLVLRVLSCGTVYCLIVGGIVWLCNVLSVEPAYLMVLIPLILSTLTDRRRIEEARAGNSKLARAMEIHGYTYSQTVHIRQEYANAIGTLTGFGIGMVLFMQDASWI
ncbi:MAG: hypothetical protein JXA82_13090 [Sedimentisphaerales bacterium]|nr:hypothetical protein [Sedimentisphaerales bacterium]